MLQDGFGHVVLRDVVLPSAGITGVPGVAALPSPFTLPNASSPPSALDDDDPPMFWPR